MNRQDEYWALIAELDQAPAALDGAVDRARARSKRARARRIFGIPAASLGGVAAAFVLLVNCSTPFAMACARVPVLRDLAAAVSFAPSLKAAVEHDFVQIVGQEQTVNGVTLRLEYLIVDRMQINFFYTLTGDAGYYSLYPSIAAPDGAGLEGYSLISGDTEAGTLSSFWVNFEAGRTVPNALRLTCAVSRREPEAEIGTFTFDLSFDPQYTATGTTYPVGDWVEVDGQRLLVESLEVNPTHARLVVDTDPANTDWLVGLDFYLEDEAGNQYEAGANNLISSGASAGDNRSTFYVESSYFGEAGSLTLHITGATWLDKDALYAHVDLETGAATGLPAGVELLSWDRRGTRVDLVFSDPSSRQLFSWDYRDPEGGEHRWDSMSSNVRDEDGDGVCETREEHITLEHYPWDAVDLELSYTRSATLPQAVSLPLK